MLDLTRYSQIVAKSAKVQRAFVVKGFVEAGTGDAHFAGEIPNGHGLIVAGPTSLYRPVEDVRLIKLFWPYHVCATSG